MTNDVKLEQYQEIIDKLHGGIELSDQEKNIVETDTAFQDYQKELNLIEKAISLNVLESKLSEVNKFEERYQAKAPIKRNLGRRSYMLFAAASILLLLAFFLFNNKGNFDVEMLAYQENVASQEPDRTRGEDGISSDDPYSLYNDEKYILAEKAFRTLISNDDNPMHKFFLGETLLKQKKWKDAENIFSDPSLKQLEKYPLTYKLGIAKLGLGKTDEAIKLLNTPTPGNMIYNELAEDLIKKLK